MDLAMRSRRVFLSILALSLATGAIHAQEATISVIDNPNAIMPPELLFFTKNGKVAFTRSGEVLFIDVANQSKECAADPTITGLSGIVSLNLKDIVMFEENGEILIAILRESNARAKAQTSSGNHTGRPARYNSYPYLFNDITSFDQPSETDYNRPRILFNGSHSRVDIETNCSFDNEIWSVWPVEVVPNNYGHFSQLMPTWKDEGGDNEEPVVSRIRFSNPFPQPNDEPAQLVLTAITARYGNIDNVHGGGFKDLVAFNLPKVDPSTFEEAQIEPVQNRAYLTAFNGALPQIPGPGATLATGSWGDVIQEYEIDYTVPVSNSYVSILSNDQDLFDARDDIDVGVLPLDVAVADVLGGDETDFIVASKWKGVLQVFSGRTNDTPSADVDMSIAPTHVAAGDFSRDLSVGGPETVYDDVVVAHRLSPGCPVWKSSGTTTAGASPIRPRSPRPEGIPSRFSSFK